jgi:hypothetical protein
MSLRDSTNLPVKRLMKKTNLYAVTVDIRRHKALRNTARLVSRSSSARCRLKNPKMLEEILLTMRACATRVLECAPVRT